MPAALKLTWVLTFGPVGDTTNAAVGSVPAPTVMTFHRRHLAAERISDGQPHGVGARIVVVVRNDLARAGRAITEIPAVTRNRIARVRSLPDASKITVSWSSGFALADGEVGHEAVWRRDVRRAAPAGSPRCATPSC